MIRLIAVAGFLAFATSAQAMMPAPIPQPDGMITQVRLGCAHLGPELMVSAWPELYVVRAFRTVGLAI